MPLPPALAAVMVAFQPLFDHRIYDRAVVLVVGALLAVRTRTVTAALRVTGRDDERFSAYHRVLNRARWSCRDAARILLGLVIDRFVPEGPVVVGIDDTIERRWGAKIAARGIYRDPVRSSRGFFVKVGGLRWLSLSAGLWPFGEAPTSPPVAWKQVSEYFQRLGSGPDIDKRNGRSALAGRNRRSARSERPKSSSVLADVPWAGRVWALPFLAVLCPSERYYERQGRPARTLTDRARQAVLQVARWLPGRRVVVVADSGFASIRLLAAVRGHVTVITRLRLDAALYDPAPPRKPGQRGRTPKKGARQPTLAARIADPETEWASVTVSRWYGRTERVVEVATGTAVWYHSGMPVVPLRWVVVRDPAGAVEPKAFLSTDPDVAPLDAVRWYVRRWAVEVTFAEARRHLGVETQRQWSDLAVLRTTPCLLGLFSVVALAADGLHAAGALGARQSPWCQKATPTFSDALAAVRDALWRDAISRMSASEPQRCENSGAVFERMSAALAYAA